MDLRTVRAFSDELEKISASPALIGAGIGAGIAGLRGGMKEWDSRLDEDRYQITPEQKKELRSRRLARLATGVALGAGAGALAGHFGGKAVRSIADEARAVANHSGQVLDRSIDRLGEHYKAPFQGTQAQALGENLGAGMKRGLKGGFWQLFKRK